MSRFLKQVFIQLLNFDGWWAAKCVSLNNQPGQFRPTLNVNPN